MIPKTTDEILEFIRKYVEKFGEVPPLDMIEGAVDFGKRGPRARMLGALQVLAYSHMQAVKRDGKPDTEAVITALTKAHGLDDGEGVLIIASPDEVREVFCQAFGETPRVPTRG